jgi:cytochrome c oxidase cbb3-type subunit 3
MLIQKYIQLKYLFSFTILLTISSWSIAQNTTVVSNTIINNPGDTLMQFLLLTMIAVLGFVLWGMGQVIIVLSKQLMVKDKNKTVPVKKAVLLFVGFSLITATTFAQGTPPLVTTSLSMAGLNQNIVYLLIAAIAVELFGVFYMAFIIKTLQRRVSNEPIIESKKNTFIAWWNEMDKSFFTKAVPIEKEADVLLDHDYDGIRELDNALPPWWKYGFYITILVAFIYLYLFHVSHTGLSPEEEYQVQNTEAQVQLDSFNAHNKNKVDENNLPIIDAVGITEGGNLYQTNCIPCHGKFAEGGAGPNLTDYYWIHKGSIKDIYLSVKNGYPDKGMQSWIVKFNPKEVLQLASYIKTLSGSNPIGAKEPQGELYAETIIVKDTLVKTSTKNPLVK